MRFFILDTYYPDFLNFFYEQNPDLANYPYTDQWQALMSQCFGTADFYSANLKQLGHEATEIIANCEPMQRQWAGEQGIKLTEARWTCSLRKGCIPWPQRIQSTDWFYRVLMAQVKHYRPDVLHIQDMNSASAAFLQEARPHVRLITGQIACPITGSSNFSEYDLVLSSLPHYVQRFREKGLHSKLFRLGFEQTLLSRLATLPVSYPVTHIGGYGPVHKERCELLESLITCGIPLSCWGYGIDHLSPASPIRRCYRGSAWGLDMYNIRHNSKIVVSKHISSVADAYANIMTLYEATGVGTLLLIDERKDLPTLFEPGKEAVTYSSPEQCLKLINHYLAHEEGRRAIALAGQQRTLREHTYYHRMQEFVGIVTHMLSQLKR